MSNVRPLQSTPSMKSRSLSHDHHYIPQCYLKGFCRADRTFDVYDKHYSKFKKRPQSPATSFFERDRNNILFRGERSDQLEKLYSRLESGIGRLFNHIRSGVSGESLLQPEGVYLLKIHMAVQFWRLPRIDEFADRYLLSRTPAELEGLCSVVRPAVLPSERLYELVQSDKGFRHYFRSFWLPLATFELSKQVPEGMSWVLLDVEDPARWSNHLCSDNPFIFLEPTNLLAFSGPFIFPLSSSRLLVARPLSNSSPSYSPSLSTRISMLLYLQATRYVAAASRPYLERILEFSESYSGSTGLRRLEGEVLGFLR